MLSDNSSTDDVPSALLSALVPHSESNTTRTMFTCSVDARWAMAIYHGGPIGDVNADYVQSATIQHIRPSGDITGYEYNFLPINDSSWRRVQIDTEWLNNLTPPSANTSSGYTSLSALLSDIGIDNSTGLIVEWGDVTPVVESVIAAMVADGMSRQGYGANGGSSTHFSDTLSLLPWDNSMSSQESLLAGTYSVPPLAGNGTMLQWTIVVGGYAYYADSTAYYLALTVLFLHAILALGHVVYILWTRICCDALDSVTGLIVLAAKSGIPRTSGSSDVFENASSGIQRYRTMGTEVRVRTLPVLGTPTGQEDLKILFGDERPEMGYETLKEGRAYG